MTKLEELKVRNEKISKILSSIGDIPAEGFREWLFNNWENLDDDTTDEDKYMLYLWNSNKRRLVAQTAMNMAQVLMGEEFQDWLYDNWDEVWERHEFEKIMSLYINGN